MAGLTRFLPRTRPEGELNKRNPGHGRGFLFQAWSLRLHRGHKIGQNNRRMILQQLSHSRGHRRIH
jgi:hypothetical protein